MTRFDKAIPFILEHEGGLSNHPNDPGGLTNRGITKRNYPHLDIVNLTLEETKAIYLKDYWFSKLDEMEDEAAAIKLFDMAVNMGRGQAVKLLQRAVGAEDDGIFGNKTLEKANACSGLVDRLCEIQDEFYHRLVLRKTSLGVFLTGWLKRARWKPNV